MTKHISVAQARATFADLIGAVYYSQEPVIVERKGKPMAVVISRGCYR
jgi:prevent-host-death family protein